MVNINRSLDIWNKLMMTIIAEQWLQSIHFTSVVVCINLKFFIKKKLIWDSRKPHLIPHRTCHTYLPLFSWPSHFYSLHYFSKAENGPRKAIWLNCDKNWSSLGNKIRTYLYCQVCLLFHLEWEIDMGKITSYFLLQHRGFYSIWNFQQFNQCFN